MAKAADAAVGSPINGGGFRLRDYPFRPAETRDFSGAAKSTGKVCKNVFPVPLIFVALCGTFCL
jgi:hypothetical protein